MTLSFRTLIEKPMTSLSQEERTFLLRKGIVTHNPLREVATAGKAGATTTTVQPKLGVTYYLNDANSVVCRSCGKRCAINSAKRAELKRAHGSLTSVPWTCRGCRQ